MLTFLARIMSRGDFGVFRGIGVDEQTALLVDTKGHVSTVGIGACF